MISVVAVRAPAEAAAEELGVDVDFVRRGLADDHAEDLHRRRRLIAGPDVDRAVVDPHGNVHRLHAHVRDVIGEVVGGKHLGGALNRRVGVADLHHVDAGLAPVGGDRPIVLQHTVVVIGLRRGRLRPRDLEQRLRFHRGVDRFGDDADAGRQRHDLDDALDRLGRAIVDLLGLFVLHLGEQDRGVQHAGDLRVDAVLRRAVDLRGHVDAAGVLADQAELRGRLEIGLGHFRQRVRHRRGLGDVAVADLAVRLGVDDHARLGGQFLGRDFPGGGGVGDQDLASLGAGEAELFVIAGDREAADGGELVVEDRIAVDLVVVRRLRDANLAPSASRSSARMSGSEVRTPWPISTIGATMVTILSSPIVTQALGA